MLPTHVVNYISPIKHMLSFFLSSLLMLSQVFECVAFVHYHNPHCRKLDPIVVKCLSLVIPKIKLGGGGGGGREGASLEQGVA
ncbi:hypothetical protein CR513_26851, partial [Mucuna pruriens]